MKARHAPRKRGRPRKERMVRLKIYLPVSVYDEYCRHAISAGQDHVTTVLRDVLMLHVHRRSGMLPVVAPELQRAIVTAIRTARPRNRP